MHESAHSLKMVKWLNTQPDTYAFKVHGGPHQKIGVSDIICCHRGHFVALEVKLPKSKTNIKPKRHLTENQKKFIREIRKACGTAHMVTTLDQVKRVIYALDEDEELQQAA